MTEAEISQLLTQKKYSDAATAGIIGNIFQETGGSYDYKQKQRNATRKAHGLFQFDPRGKLPDYRAWLKENKLKDSAQSQIDFFHDTIYGDSQDIIGSGNAAKLRELFKVGDAETIAKSLSALWFKPKKPMMENRVGKANELYSQDYPNEERRLALGETPPAPVQEDTGFFNSLLEKFKWH